MNVDHILDVYPKLYLKNLSSLMKTDIATVTYP